MNFQGLRSNLRSDPGEPVHFFSSTQRKVVTTSFLEEAGYGDSRPLMHCTVLYRTYIEGPLEENFRGRQGQYKNHNGREQATAYEWPINPAAFSASPVEQEQSYQSMLQKHDLIA